MSDRYKCILLVGAPGAGKGTQGKILGSIPGFYHLACGDVFRSLDLTSSLGKKFMEYSSWCRMNSPWRCGSRTCTHRPC